MCRDLFLEELQPRSIIQRINQKFDKDITSEARDRAEQVDILLDSLNASTDEVVTFFFDILEETGHTYLKKCITIDNDFVEGKLVRIDSPQLHSSLQLISNLRIPNKI